MGEKRDLSYESLTSLRGIFIVLIVLFHIRETFNYCFPNMFNIANKYIYLGNAYFFMVSGFLTNHTYKTRILDKKINFFAFVKRKVQKLYPLYFLSNLYLLIVNIYSIGFNNAFKIKDVLIIASMTCWGWVKNVRPYNFPCWFVSVLVLCYILYFLLVKLFGANLKYYMISICFMVLLGGFLILKDYEFPFLYLQNGEAYINFFMGVFLNEILLKIKNKNKFYLICFILGLLGSINTLEFKIIISLFICPLIIILATQLKHLAKILSCLPFFLLGKLSMSIFFLHGPLYISFAFLRNKVLIISNLNMKIQLVIFFILLILVSTITEIFQNFVIKKIIKDKKGGE